MRVLSRLSFGICCLSLGLSLGLSLISSNVQAKGFLDPFKDPDDGWIDGSDWLLNNAVGFMPLPIFITEPAIGAGLGVAGLFFHPPKDPDPEAEFVFPSVSAVAGAITSNDTWFVGGGHFGNWKQDSIRYSGFVGYASVNIKFYPTFGDVDPEIGLKFNAEGAFVSQELLFRMGRSHFWLGANQELAGVDVDFAIEGLPPVDADALEVTSSALGLTAKYENVDSTFTPSRGLIAKLQYLRYDESIASDFDANKINANLFKYWQLLPNLVLGLRLDGKFSNGDLPFYMQPFIDLRGIPAMRYQGSDVVVGETELRWNFHPRIGLVGFIGSGWAADAFDELDDASSRVTKGVGIRYYAAKKLGLHMGFDVARGPEDTAFYITFGSAWR
jgi:hypothetical protein